MWRTHIRYIIFFNEWNKKNVNMNSLIFIIDIFLTYEKKNIVNGNAWRTHSYSSKKYVSYIQLRFYSTFILKIGNIIFIFFIGCKQILPLCYTRKKMVKRFLNMWLLKSDLLDMRFLKWDFWNAISLLYV